MAARTSRRFFGARAGPVREARADVSLGLRLLCTLWGKTSCIGTYKSRILSWSRNERSLRAELGPRPPANLGPPRRGIGDAARLRFRSAARASLEALAAWRNVGSCSPVPRPFSPALPRPRARLKPAASFSPDWRPRLRRRGRRLGGLLKRHRFAACNRTQGASGPDIMFAACNCTQGRAVQTPSSPRATCTQWRADQTPSSPRAIAGSERADQTPRVSGRFLPRIGVVPSRACELRRCRSANSEQPRNVSEAFARHCLGTTILSDPGTRAARKDVEFCGP